MSSVFFLHLCFPLSYLSSISMYLCVSPSSCFHIIIHYRLGLVHSDHDFCFSRVDTEKLRACQETVKKWISNEMEILDSSKVSTLRKSGEHDMPTIKRELSSTQQKPMDLLSVMLVRCFLCQNLEDLAGSRGNL